MSAGSVGASAGVGVSGIGSWPGEDSLDASRRVLDVLTSTPSGIVGIPYLPELPARGPWASMIGRAAGLLVDLPLALDGDDWRIASAPGRDVERSRSMLASDLELFAAQADGWDGQLKLSVSGPWTLAASIWLRTLDRALLDHGAVSDIAASLAEGITDFVKRASRLVPNASIVVQIDEPSLVAVRRGLIPTMSGRATHRAVSFDSAIAHLASVTGAARAAGASYVVGHCCAQDVPLAELRDGGCDAVSADISLLDGAAWEGIAEYVESGGRLWAGVAADDGAGSLATAWSRVGLEKERLADVVVTPACGLAGLTPEGASGNHRELLTVARRLMDVASS